MRSPPDADPRNREAVGCAPRTEITHPRRVLVRGVNSVPIFLQAFSPEGLSFDSESLTLVVVHTWYTGDIYCHISLYVVRLIIEKPPSRTTRAPSRTTRAAP